MPFNQPIRHTSRRNTFGSLLVLGVLVAGLAVAVLHGPRLYDHYAAAQYTPDSRMSEVANKLQLTDEGERLLYASHPRIEQGDEFNEDCQSTERTAAMLGCYYQRKIFLYDVQHAELEGVVEVTAAHEMLHAAYDRLNLLERPHVDELLRSEYESVKDHPEIKSLMEYYKKAQPGTDINELHSIIGTTITEISPRLEEYYARYFTDRQAVVAMNQRYNAVFNEVQGRAEQLSLELKTEADRINAELAAYEFDQQQLESDIASFNARASSGEFSSRQSFEAARSALSARLTNLEYRRVAINNRVSAYNTRVEELNALSVKAHELNKSINGVAQPTTGL